MKKACAILILIILIISSISFGIVESTTTKTFKDIDENAWYYNDVIKMIEYEIINGYDDNTFKPNNFVKRNEYAKMLVKSLKIPTSDTNSSFIDLKNSDWETKYVESAKYYLTGYKTAEGNLFKPNEDTLREDIMVALVKALEYDYKNIDTNILDTYADYNKISANLRPYVAVAIKKGIVTGYEMNNKKYIKPLEPITRAETATLLMKVINEEKITFDEIEKVTFDENDSVTSSVKITSTKNDGKLKLNWTEINSADIRGYKVIISKDNEKPKYPKDGYYRFLQNTDHVEIIANSNYNGGDISIIKPNDYYYFNVNTLYKDGSVKLSNTLKLKVPESTNIEPINTDIILKGTIKDNNFNLSWDKYTGNNFKGYKVVASINDATPTYPENGYYRYITNSDSNSINIPIDSSYKNGDFEKFITNQNYNFSITILTNSGKIYSNTVRLKK